MKNRWYKKIVLMGAFITLLVSCSKQDGFSSDAKLWRQKSGKLKVLSTTTIIDSMVAEIGKERIHHISLINGDIDPHNYELVKGDDEKFALADIVLSNGLGLEHGASLRAQIEKHKNSIAVGEEVKKRFPDEILYFAGEPDPHIWTSVALWEKTISPIVDALSSLDPEGKEFYEENAQALLIKMKELNKKIHQDFSKVPFSKRYLVTTHDAFHYYTKEYLATEEERKLGTWKERCASPEGISPEGQLSVSDIKNMVEYLCLHHVHVVFPESNLNKDSLRKIVSVCKSRGLEVKIAEEELYGDTLGPLAESTYFTMMEHNTEVLCKEWEK